MLRRGLSSALRRSAKRPRLRVCPPRRAMDCLRLSVECRIGRLGRPGGIPASPLPKLPAANVYKQSMKPITGSIVGTGNALA